MEEMTGGLMTGEALMDLLNQTISSLVYVDGLTGHVYEYRRNGKTMDPTGISSCDFDTVIRDMMGSFVPPEDQANFAAQLSLRSLMQKLTVQPILCRSCHLLLGGKPQNCEMRFLRVMEKNALKGFIVSVMQAGADMNLANHAESIETDELTGLYTRQAFNRLLRETLNRDQQSKWNVSLLDIENFKQINSIYGEAMGDEILRYVADWTRTKPYVQLCGRYSGDEIVLLTKYEFSADEASVEKEINELRQKAPVPYLYFRIGVNRDVDPMDSVGEMCEKAQLALKSIKHNYDRFVASYDGKVVQQHIRAQLYEARFEKALSGGEFVVWCQPKYHSLTEELVGAEALIRWRNRDGKMISPGEFIPVFEEDGLIYNLDLFVFRFVCRKQKEMLSQGVKPFPISINMSRSTLYHSGIVAEYRLILKEAGIPPELVPIELTESATVAGTEIHTLVEQLRQAGFVLHMDDFGTGYSSLSSLSSLPFTCIKLDKSLIDDIGNPNGDELLRHTVELCHFLKMQVVAEGVEAQAQLNFLRQLGCDVIQGYYFCRPVPYEEYQLLLVDNRRREESTEIQRENLQDQVALSGIRLTNELKMQYLAAISSIYMTMHVINLAENTVFEFATTTNVREFVNRAHNAVQQMAAAMRGTVSPEDIDAVLTFTDLTTVKQRLKNKRTLTMDFRGIHFGWCQARFICVTTDRNDDPEVVIFTTHVLESDSRREEQLIRVCRTDELTGVGNRTALDEEIKRLSADKPPMLVCLAGDINALKQYNESYGHAAGDDLLWGFADCMIRSFAGCGKVFRVNGDKFAVFFEADETEKQQRLQELQKNVDSWAGNHASSLSVCFGVAALQERPEESPELLMERAFERLKAEKEAWNKARSGSR